MVEHPAENRGVGGSSPPWATLQREVFVRRINVAIAGLGRVGSQFFDALLSVSTDAVKVIKSWKVSKKQGEGNSLLQRCQRHAKIP